MDVTKAVAKLRAQSAANRTRATEMTDQSVQIIRAAEERYAELRLQAQEELDEAAYWDRLADQEAEKIPPAPEAEPQEQQAQG